MNAQPLTVLKFGSSVLREESDLARAVSEIYRFVREGAKVVAVVSALGRTTDALLGSARRLVDSPPAEPLAALLATGESQSAALLTLALCRSGIPCRLLTPPELGLRIAGPLLDGEPVAVDRTMILAALRHSSVAVLPGFFGVSQNGKPALLGRGGSDLTALFIAHQLEAERCRLLKDVPGVFLGDPKAAPTKPDRYRTLSFETALRLGGKVVQDKAASYAQRVGQSFEIAAPGDDFATRIGSFPDTLERLHGERPPLRVALLGLGTVGLGVHAHLDKWPERFECVGVAVRDGHRIRGVELAAGLLHEDPWSILGRAPDIVVEAIGGRKPAFELLLAALRGGSHVVTANKTVVAEEGAQLADWAARHGRQFRFAAAVGGGVPVLEAATRWAGLGSLRSVSGVLNGTSNFVLDRMGEGASLAEAVRAAQLLGLAEADPSDDLGGADTARKLAIICQTAFGIRVNPRDIRCQGIQDLAPETVLRAREAGHAIRLVGSCTRGRRGIVAEVRPRRLGASHPLAGCQEEENRVVIRPERGPATVLAGKGAGRWPTSESILADLLDLSRLASTEPRIDRERRARRRQPRAAGPSLPAEEQ